MGTYQLQASLKMIDSVQEWSICMFPGQIFSRWICSVKCFHASVHQWTGTFFLCRTDAFYSPVPLRHATHGQTWGPGPVSSTLQSIQRHPWQVQGDMGELCLHQLMPLSDELDQTPETPLKEKKQNSLQHILVPKWQTIQWLPEWHKSLLESTLSVTCEPIAPCMYFYCYVSTRTGCTRPPLGPPLLPQPLEVAA